jgi:hypothetical protein
MSACTSTKKATKASVLAESFDENAAKEKAMLKKQEEIKPKNIVIKKVDKVSEKVNDDVSEKVSVEKPKKKISIVKKGEKKINDNIVENSFHCTEEDIDKAHRVIHEYEEADKDNDFREDVIEFEGTEDSVTEIEFDDHGLMIPEKMPLNTSVKYAPKFSFEDIVRKCKEMHIKLVELQKESGGKIRPLNGIFGAYTLLSVEDFDRFKNCPMYLSACDGKGNLYVAVTVDGKSQRLSRYLLNAPSNMYVDHKNSTTLDNRPANLRLATPEENGQNKKKREGATSPYHGVYQKDDQFAFWIRYPQDRGDKCFQICGFKTDIDAAIARDIYLVHHNLDGFKKLNFPEKKDYYNSLEKKPEWQRKYYGIEELDDGIFQSFIRDEKKKKIPIYKSSSCMECIEKRDLYIIKNDIKCARLNLPDKYHRLPVIKTFYEENPDGSLSLLLDVKNHNILIDEKDYDLIKYIKWHTNTSGYVSGRIDDKEVLMHRFLMKPDINLVVDHQNHIRSDNRRDNLSIVTRSQNAMNRAKSFDKISDFLGITRCRGLWTGSTKVEGKVVFYISGKSEEYVARAKDLYNMSLKKSYSPWCYDDWTDELVSYWSKLIKETEERKKRFNHTYYSTCFSKPCSIWMSFFNIDGLKYIFEADTLELASRRKDFEIIRMGLVGDKYLLDNLWDESMLETYSAKYPDTKDALIIKKSGVKGLYYDYLCKRWTADIFSLKLKSRHNTQEEAQKRLDYYIFKNNVKSGYVLSKEWNDEMVRDYEEKNKDSLGAKKTSGKNKYIGVGKRDNKYRTEPKYKGKSIILTHDDEKTVAYMRDGFIIYLDNESHYTKMNFSKKESLQWMDENPELRGYVKNKIKEKFGDIKLHY